VLRVPNPGVRVAVLPAARSPGRRCGSPTRSRSPPDTDPRSSCSAGRRRMGDPEAGVRRGARARRDAAPAAFPDTRFEVINAAMTAINSHVVRDIAADVRSSTTTRTCWSCTWATTRWWGRSARATRWCRWSDSLAMPSGRPCSSKGTRLGQLGQRNLAGAFSSSSRPEPRRSDGAGWRCSWRTRCRL
jgi:hypothetical protein